MEISTEWVLGSFLALTGVIGTMAKLIYNALSERIKDQNTCIHRLQDDVDRLSKGCGIYECAWAHRGEIRTDIKQT